MCLRAVQVVVCGTTRLLCESASVQANAPCWLQLLSGLCVALEPSAAGQGAGAAGDAEDGAVEVEVGGFEAEAMNRLHFTGAAAEDLVPEVCRAQEEEKSALSGALAQRNRQWSHHS